MTKTNKIGENEGTNDFFMAGTKSYVDALIAIREYRELVINASREVLEDRIQSLGQAMDKNITKKDILPYAEPDRISKEYDGSSAWLAARVPCSPEIYFGMSIDIDEDHGQYVPYATVMMATQYKDDLYAKISESCDEVAEGAIGVRSCHRYSKEICLFMEFKNIDDYRFNLNRLSDCWVEVWKKVRAKK